MWAYRLLAFFVIAITGLFLFMWIHQGIIAYGDRRIAEGRDRAWLSTTVTMVPWVALLGWVLVESDVLG